MDEAKRLAAEDGVALNQFINVAVAEKISALRTVEYLRGRPARGSVDEAKTILRKAGKGGAVVAGDELGE